MLKTELIHPELLKSIAAAGHGAQILITDGNYPSSTKTDSSVEKVYLNLAPGLINATQVLEVLTETINVEAATVMEPNEGEDPLIFNEFKKILPENTEFNKLERFDFYDNCVDNNDLCAVIVTGEQRIYANLLLTIGVV